MPPPPQALCLLAMPLPAKPEIYRNGILVLCSTETFPKPPPALRGEVPSALAHLGCRGPRGPV